MLFRSPDPATVSVGMTQEFTGTAYDVFSIVIWGVGYVWATNVGTIDNTGMFTAQLVPGSGIVTAANGTVTDTASVTVEENTFSIDLIVGWNLISIPLIMPDTSILSVLSSISGDWDYVLYYNSTDASDHWKSYATFKPSSLNDLWDIDHTMGFWLRATNNTILTVYGQLPGNVNISLYAGWNLIGYPVQDDSNYTVGDLKLDTGADIVEGYNSSAEYQISVLPDSYILKKGEAYWVHMTSDMVWALTSSSSTSDSLLSDDAGSATGTRGKDEVSGSVIETASTQSSATETNANEITGAGGNEEYRRGSSSEGITLLIALATMLISMVYLPIRRRRERNLK